MCGSGSWQAQLLGGGLEMVSMLGSGNDQGLSCGRMLVHHSLALLLQAGTGMVQVDKRETE